VGDLGDNVHIVKLGPVGAGPPAGPFGHRLLRSRRGGVRSPRPTVVPQNICRCEIKHRRGDLRSPATPPPAAQPVRDVEDAVPYIVYRDALYC